MLNRKMLSAAVVIGALTAGMAAPALAQHGPGMGGPGMGGWHHAGGGILQGVTLTTAQKQQIHALLKAAHQNHALFQQMRSVHQQIEAEMFSTGTVTETMLQPLLQQQAALAQQIQAQRLTTELAIRNVLTPAQLATAASTHAKLAALREQAHAVMQQNAGSTSPAEGN